MRKVYLRNEYITSMKELINRYQEAMDRGISKEEYEDERGLTCLLCHPIGVDREELHKLIDDIGVFDSCQICPWFVLTSRSCTVNVEGNHAIFETEDEELIKGRIDQLGEWIRKYEQCGDMTRVIL